MSSVPAAPPVQASCLPALAAIPGNRVTAASPAPQDSDPACRIDEPVRVEALAIRGQGGPATIAFEPPPLLSCAMASTLAGWLDRSVQPLARGHFERDLVALRVGGGHECRRRNRASAGPVSEHATGQALDIFAFKLGSGSEALQVAVEKPQGLAQNRFLEAIRQSACGAFMTTLGPGSDAAHANHLHVDIQERRSRASRFCQ
uniref:Extensin family protein n=1 Tax=Bosea sp. NBC_00436 TaxID=2969620 RepID=A0A9E7ZSX8_9HYPH